jgi:hypothetical protein
VGSGRLGYLVGGALPPPGGPVSTTGSTAVSVSPPARTPGSAGLCPGAGWAGIEGRPGATTRPPTGLALEPGTWRPGVSLTWGVRLRVCLVPMSFMARRNVRRPSASATWAYSSWYVYAVTAPPP